LQLGKRKPFAKEPTRATSINRCVFKKLWATTSLTMISNFPSAAYGADRESFDAMFISHIDLEPDHDHDSA